MHFFCFPKSNKLTNVSKFYIMSIIATQNGVSFGKSTGRTHCIKNAR